MKKLLISSAAIALLFVGCNSNNAPTQSTETVTNKTVKVTGIREADLTKGSQNLAKIEYTSAAPMKGQAKPFAKSFNDAPPMIPHSVAGMTPIKIGQNQCIGCHMPQTAKAMGIKAIPASHFKSGFSNAKGKLAGSRYNCTQCHAPQATLDPVIENRFQSLKK
jgi:cytochrome c-type protein NapB